VTDDASTPRPPARAPRQARRGRRPVADEIRSLKFPVGLRGYDRGAVDAWVQEVAGMVANLEATQSRDSVVKAALDEVGEHTGDILKKAHEAADEISSQSRSQADGRLRRAETEAETLIRDAEARARELENDLRALWDERVRMIEDLRQLSDQLMALADDAGERLDPPGREEEIPAGQPADADAETQDERTGAVEGDDGYTDETPGLPDQPTMESQAARPDTESPAGEPGEGSGPS
jgi:cell division initiation protein